MDGAAVLAAALQAAQLAVEHAAARVDVPLAVATVPGIDEVSAAADDALGHGRHEDAALLGRRLQAPKSARPRVQTRQQQVELGLRRHNHATRTL